MLKAINHTCFFRFIILMQTTQLKKFHKSSGTLNNIYIYIHLNNYLKRFSALKLSHKNPSIISNSLINLKSFQDYLY